MLLYKPKKSQSGKGKRLLVSVTVMGSAGPLRFVVGEDELVAAVIDTALKCYAREGRLPLLSSDFNDFLLYSPNFGPEALSPLDTIGSQGSRNFMLCKKPQASKAEEESAKENSRKASSANWKSWINKSLNLKITSH